MFWPAAETIEAAVAAVRAGLVLSPAGAGENPAPAHAGPWQRHEHGRDRARRGGDIRRSVELIELHCPNPGARHLCYPWYAGDARTDGLVFAAGVTVVYREMDGHTNRAEPNRPAGVQRLGPEFIWRLPGLARLGLGRSSVAGSPLLCTGGQPAPPTADPWRRAGRPRAWSPTSPSM